MWHLFSDKNVSNYERQMLALRHSCTRRCAPAGVRAGGGGLLPATGATGGGLPTACTHTPLLLPRRPLTLHTSLAPRLHRPTLPPPVLSRPLKVPPWVVLAWVSPPPRNTLKAPQYKDLPAE